MIERLIQTFGRGSKPVSEPKQVQDSLLEANVNAAIAKTIQDEVASQTATLRSANESLGHEIDVLRAKLADAEARLKPLQPLLDRGVTADALCLAAYTVGVLKNPQDMKRAYAYLAVAGWKENNQRDWVDPVTKASMIFHGALQAQLKRDTAIFEKL